MDIQKAIYGFQQPGMLTKKETKEILTKEE
jgi:hypothetical protein